MPIINIKFENKTLVISYSTDFDAVKGLLQKAGITYQNDSFLQKHTYRITLSDNTQNLIDILDIFLKQFENEDNHILTQTYQQLSYASVLAENEEIKPSIEANFNAIDDHYKIKSMLEESCNDYKFTIGTYTISEFLGSSLPISTLNAGTKKCDEDEDDDDCNASYKPSSTPKALSIGFPESPITKQLRQQAAETATYEKTVKRSPAPQTMFTLKHPTSGNSQAEQQQSNPTTRLLNPDTQSESKKRCCLIL